MKTKQIYFFIYFQTWY